MIWFPLDRVRLFNSGRLFGFAHCFPPFIVADWFAVNEMPQATEWSCRASEVPAIYPPAFSGTHVRLSFLRASCACELYRPAVHGCQWA